MVYRSMALVYDPRPTSALLKPWRINTFMTRLSFYLLILIGCLSSKARASSFHRPNVIGVQPLNMVLPFLEPLLNRDQYKVYRYEVNIESLLTPSSLRLADDGKYLSVSLYNVTKPQCDRLKKLMAQDRSLVKCDSIKDKKNFELSQFLEPIIQATQGLTWVPQVTVLSLGWEIKEGDLGPTADYDPSQVEYQDSQGNELIHSHTIQTNCWGTAWEVARQSKDSFYVQQGDGSEIFKLFKGNQLTRTLSTPQKMNSQDRSKIEKSLLAKLQYSDILLISNESGDLEHVATAIGSKLFFERTGSQGMYLNRIVSLDDIISRYNHGIYTLVRPNEPFPDLKLTYPKALPSTQTTDSSNPDYEGISSTVHFFEPEFGIRADAESESYVIGQILDPLIEEKTLLEINKILAGDQTSQGLANSSNQTSQKELSPVTLSPIMGNDDFKNIQQVKSVLAADRGSALRSLSDQDKLALAREIVIREVNFRKLSPFQIILRHLLLGKKQQLI